MLLEFGGLQFKIAFFDFRTGAKAVCGNCGLWKLVWRVWCRIPALSRLRAWAVEACSERMVRNFFELVLRGQAHFLWCQFPGRAAGRPGLRTPACLLWCPGLQGTRAVAGDSRSMVPHLLSRDWHHRKCFALLSPRKNFFGTIRCKPHAPARAD